MIQTARQPGAGLEVGMRRIFLVLVVAAGLSGCAVCPDGSIVPVPAAVPVAVPVPVAVAPAPVYVAPRPVAVAPAWGFRRW